MQTQAEPLQFQGQEAVRLQAPDGSHAVVMRHGAQVVSWVSAAGVEQLYLSPLARWGAGQAIRGGMPVIFPQFAERGPGPRHGFARTSDWTVQAAQAQDDSAQVELTLASSPATLALWPHDFECKLSVKLSSGSLTVSLRVTNTGDAPWVFAAALHNYLQVGALDSAALAGLQGLSFEDTLQTSDSVRVEQLPVLRVTGPIDRIYHQVPGALHLSSANGVLHLTAQGFQDAVVWNPGEQAAADMTDLPKDDYQQFLCVECAVIAQPVRLLGGASWSGSQQLQAL